MKVKALLVDDEPKILKMLELKVEQHCPEITEVRTSTNIQDAYAIIEDYRPDVVFLDINMSTGSGFELLERYEDIPFEVIFVTGYSEFALKAIKLCVLDYILKPIDNDELIRAVQKLIDKLEKKRRSSERLNYLKYNMNNLGNQTSKICIPSTSNYEFHTISNIIRCEGDNKYTKIYMRNGKQCLSSYNIGVFTEKLQSYNFFLTHKSHLINVNNIKSYSNDGVVTMEDESKIPVSRRKRSDFVRNVITKIN